MSDKPSLSPQKRHQLAAEHALGVLRGEERSQAIALARDDDGFRADVARWRGRFGPWLEEVVEAEAPEHVWREIERRIGEQRSGPTLVALKRRLNVWRGFAAAASAIAASLAFILFTRPEPTVPPVPQVAPLVATLTSETTQDRLVATWDPTNRNLVVAAAAGMRTEPGKDHELWVIAKGGKPMPVGIMHAKGPMRMNLAPPMADQLKNGVTLAISVEPAGGSPTGLPTGPVIAAGQLEQT
jgi:anti-sigma-K factor RskA